MMELTIMACRISLLHLVRFVLRDGVRTRKIESLPLEIKRHSLDNIDEETEKMNETWSGTKNGDQTQLIERRKESQNIDR